MAATGAKAGFGALLKIGDGATPTEVFTTIAEVVNITPPSHELETADATHMESPNGFRERIATVLNAGEGTFELNFLPDDTSQDQLITDQEAKTLRNFQITIPGSSPAKRYAFSAFVTSIGESIPFDDKMTRNVTLTLSGKRTIEADS